MIEMAALVGVAAVLGAVLLTVLDSAPSAAQAPTPAATQIAPGVSTVSPLQVVVTPVTNVAESTTQPLSSADDSSGVKTGVIAGIAAAGAVIFAGIAYRLARRRPRAG